MSLYQAAEKLFLHARLTGKARRARREGSRSEVRDFLNFEPRSSNFGSRLVRRQVRSSTADPRFTFHASRFDKLTVPSQVEGRFTAPVQHPATHPAADIAA